MGISFYDDNGNNISMTFEEHNEYMRPARLLWEEGVWAQRTGSGLAFEQFIRDNVAYLETDDIIMFLVDPEFHFEVGKQYMRADGKLVTVVEQHGECIRCDDGDEALKFLKNRQERLGVEIEDYEPTAETLGWRYQRDYRLSDLGRCTGSQWNNPRNLIPLDLTKLKKAA